MAALDTPATNFTADNFRRVKVLYDYNYQDETAKTEVWMKTDEIFYLLNSDEKEWWEVCRPDSPENHFYVPSTYVEILSNVSGSSNSQQLGHVGNNIHIKTHSILNQTVRNNMLSTFKASVDSEDNESDYVNVDAPQNTESGNSDSKSQDIKVQYFTSNANRPNDLNVDDDYVNLEQFREAAGISSLNSSESHTPPSPKTPEGESEYANLQQLEISEPGTPDIEHGEFQKTLQDTWDVYKDPASNRLFYVNKHSHETQWKPPRGQFHEELHKKRSGNNSPTKSPPADSENKSEFPTVQGGLVQGPRPGDRSQVSDRFAKSRSVMIENLHFTAPPINTGPPPPKSATLPPNFTAPIPEDLCVEGMVSGHSQNHDNHHPQPVFQSVNINEPIEGFLNKCKFINGKRPSKKWAMTYVKLGGSNLVFYKDQKSSQAKSGAPYGKYDQLVSLATCTVDKDTEKYTSKKNTIGITCPDCQILLQADDELKMQEWFMKIHTRINELGGNADLAQTSTQSLTPDTVSRKPSFKDKGHGRKQSDSGTLERKGKIKNVLERFMSNRSEKEKLIKKGIYKDAVFGSDIKQLCAKEKMKVPMFVIKSIEAIEKRGLEHEGIYRIGGNISQIQKLRCMVDQGEQYDLDDPLWDVNVLTGTLKLFFREMKDPLFTYALFDKFLKSFLIEKSTDRFKGIKTTLEELPKPNYDTIKVLFKHLSKVNELSKENKMAAHQLAIVFGPTLIWPEVQHQNLATSMVYQSRIVEYVLLEYTKLFR